MKLICPVCKSAGSFVISHSIDLPDDLRAGSDELSLQVVNCSACGFGGTAVYEESRRGASESVHHYCFRAEAGALTKLSQLIESCPSRNNPRCACSAHYALSARDAAGNWLIPTETHNGKTFAIKLG
jgi:hypothetical protein